MKNKYQTVRSSLMRISSFTRNAYRKAKCFVVMTFLTGMLGGMPAVQAQIQVELTNGGSSGNSSVSGPLYQSGQNGNNARHIYLYTQSELAAAGIFPGSVITSLAWYKANTAVLINNAEAKMYMFQRSGSALTEYGTGVPVLEYTDTSAASGNGWEYIGTAEYDVTNNLPNVINWMEVSITPFTYTGGGLEIYIHNMLIQDVGNVTSATLSFRRQSGPNTNLYSTNASPGPTTAFTRQGYRPDLLVTFTRPANNTLVGSVAEPVNFCAGTHDIKVDLQNNGSNIINNVQIHWTMNGVAQTPVNWTTPLDTIGGTGSNSAVVTLQGNVNFAANTSVTIKAWTMLPNGVSVPVRPTDTLYDVLRAGLSGNYTIGGVTPDFAEFTDAVDALNKYGVCGPVQMDIRPGTYDGQSVLGNVSGVDMNNTITFRSTTGNRDDVHITNAQTGSGDNYVLRLTNISYVTFKHITLEATGTSASYTTVVDMWDTVSNITIDSCRIKARVSTSTSSSGALVYARGGTLLSTNFVGGDLSFTNNDFWGGGTAIYLYGASTMLVNAVIENNTIDSAGAYGVYLYYTSNIKLRNNSINIHPSVTTSTQYGGYIYYAYEGTEVTGNRIHVPLRSSGSAAYGLYFYYTYGNAAQNAVTANNIIVAGGNTGTSYGIYAMYGAYHKTYNNSVHLIGGSASSYAGYFNYTNSTYSNNEVLNNIFANTNGGRGVMFYAGPTSYETVFDYNNIYTTGTLLVVSSNATTIPASAQHTTIAEWRAATGQGMNSLSYHPAFASSTDLTPDPADSASWALNGRGIHIPGNNADINGNPRSEIPPEGVPDLGAIEFTPTALPPLATAAPDTIATGTTQVFTFGGDTVARITWNSATTPASVDVRQYSGAIPPAYTAPDTMYFYTTVEAGGAPYDYDLDVYYKDPWIGSVKAENAVRLAEQPGGTNPWVFYPGTGSASDTGRNIITAAGLTALGNYTGGGEPCSGQPLAPVFVTPSITTPQCPGSMYALVTKDPDPTSGITYQWQQAPSGAGPWTNVSGAGTQLMYQTPALPDRIYYRVKATCANSGDSAFSASYEIPILPSAQMVSWQDGSRCGAGTVLLEAQGTPGSTLYWYDSPSGGLLLDTGATYTTPVLTSDSVFYVAASSGPKEERVPSPPAGLEYISLNSGQGVSFIVNNLVTINTVDMYVRNNSVGNATVQILITEPDLSDTVFYGPVHSFTAQTTPALEVVPVQATLVPGSYRMVMLYSGINGAVRTLVSSVGGGNLPYPYTSPSNSVSIIHAHGGTSNTNTVAYNFFYNWSVSVPCESPRQAVTATLGSAPSFEVTATSVVCNDDVATLAVTSPAANFDSVTWAPVAGLFTDAAGTIPYTGGNANTVYARTAVPGQYAFWASAHNTITGCGNIDTARPFVQPARISATANPASICMNGATTLRLDHASDFGNGSIQWQSSPDGISYTDLPGATLPTYATGLLNATSYYRVVAKNSDGAACVSLPLTVTVNETEVLSANSVIRCGPDSVTLTATGSAGSVMKWYDAISGGALLDTGNSFTTPFLNNTTTFYVSAGGGKQTSYFGKQYRTVAGTGVTGDTGSLVFDSYTGFTLESVGVYPVGSGTGTITIALLSASGVVLDSATVSVAGSPAPGYKTEIPLNFAVPVGPNMRLSLRRVSGGITGTSREVVPGTSTEIIYPYTLAGVASITRSTTNFTTNKVYQHFYDWKVSLPCESPRTPVTATITPPPIFTAESVPAVICIGDTAMLTATSANTGYTYEWTPGSVSGDTVPVTPTANTIYYVKALDNSGGPNDGCVGYDSLTVAVSPLPVAILTNTGATAFCEGDSVLLFASTGAGYSYQWQRDNADVPGAVNSSFYAKEDGLHTVRVTDVNSCSATSDPEDITVHPTPEPVIVPDGAGLATGNYNSYQWYRDGNLIPGATSRQYTPEGDGNYTVMVRDAQDCSGMSAPYRFTVGVQHINLRPDVRIYPNPASSTVYIESPIPVEVTLSSVDGKVVFQQKRVQQIDISSLSDAVYIIRIADLDGQVLHLSRLVKAAK